MNTQRVMSAGCEFSQVLQYDNLYILKKAVFHVFLYALQHPLAKQ